ncbi:hypothetical protein [Cerasicoccus arenae]|uniref:Uncharacterized protein n=1 Tax=Cerasicoccus arenae TaxID=424488 RepID=A0A8J3DHT9_9BACT|nr:hypothetical protein [Cerasicoccus arenae]MBK1858238.1 hypothetical protein [Cerasicoccus arenae]GHC02086.1 hypothetical protein GCM10007047_18250 [Cerasicoccus arenae]
MPTDWDNTAPGSISGPSASWDNTGPGAVSGIAPAHENTAPPAIAGPAPSFNNTAPGDIEPSDAFPSAKQSFTLTGGGETAINGLYVYAGASLNGKPAFMQSGHDRNSYGTPNGTVFFWTESNWRLNWVSSGGGSSHESLTTDGGDHPIIDATISNGGSGTLPVPVGALVAPYLDVSSTHDNTAPGALSAPSQGHDNTAPASLSAPTQGHDNTAPVSLTAPAQGHDNTAPGSLTAPTQNHDNTGAGSITAPTQNHSNTGPASLTAPTQGHANDAPGSLASPSQGHSNAAPGNLSTGADWDNTASLPNPAAVSLCPVVDENGERIYGSDQTEPILDICPLQTSPFWTSNPPGAIAVA